MNDPSDRPGSAHTVDSWRFAGSFLKSMLSKMIPAAEFAGEIPWTPIAKPLSDCRVALLSSAGLSMRGDPPFDMDFERRNPTRGDHGWRRLQATATEQNVVANHLHIDTGYIERDLEVALPLRSLQALAAAGVIGEVAPSHYAIMGFQGNDSSRLVEESAPAIAAAMRDERVDIALLAPV